METCSKCGAEISSEDKNNHTVYEAGFKVTLVNGVTSFSCACCNETHTEIADIEGLYIAISLKRISHPLKLNGTELKFIRKSMGFSAKELASFIETTPETLSRWENDRAPISPASERLFRSVVHSTLSNEAPLIHCDMKAITAMKVQSLSGSPERLHLKFVRLKREQASYAEAA